jgi:hypothetical protein
MASPATWTNTGRTLAPVAAGWGGPGDDWERAPYYYDGLLPLAYLLDDQALIAKANKYIRWALNSRRPNGYFGPANPDWRPCMVTLAVQRVMLKVLAAYYEAAWDERVLARMAAYFSYMRQMLDAQPLHTWASARAAENLLVIHWLYNLTAPKVHTLQYTRRGGDASLLPLGRQIQQQGMDWPALQGRYEIEKALPLRQYRGNMGTHVVNNAQGIKTGAVWFVQSGNAWH